VHWPTSLSVLQSRHANRDWLPSVLPIALPDRLCAVIRSVSRETYARVPAHVNAMGVVSQPAKNAIGEREIADLLLRKRRRVGLCHSLQQMPGLTNHAYHNWNRTQCADRQQPPSSASPHIPAKPVSEQES
jgi:hypothetical protein